MYRASALFRLNRRRREGCAVSLEVDEVEDHNDEVHQVHIHRDQVRRTCTEGEPVPYEVILVKENVRKNSGGHREVAGHQAMPIAALQERVLATVNPQP